MRGLSVSDAAAIVGGELHGSDNSDSKLPALYILFDPSCLRH